MHRHSDVYVEHTICALIDGIKILSDWSVSQDTPREEIVDYIDDVYMKKFLRKVDQDGKSRLAEYWKQMKHRV